MLLVILGQILQKQIRTQKMHLPAWLPSLPSVSLSPTNSHLQWGLCHLTHSPAFCNTPLQSSGDSTACQRGQYFGACHHSDLPYILNPHFPPLCRHSLITFHFLHPFTTSTSAIFNWRLFLYSSSSILWEACFWSPPIPVLCLPL